MWPLRLGGAACLLTAPVVLRQAAPNSLMVAGGAVLLWVPIFLSILVACALVPRISCLERLSPLTRSALAGLTPALVLALALTPPRALVSGGNSQLLVEFYRPAFLFLPSFGLLLIQSKPAFRRDLAWFAACTAALLVSLDLSLRSAWNHDSNHVFVELAASFYFSAKFPVTALLLGVAALAAALARLGSRPPWLGAARTAWVPALAFVVLASPSAKLLKEVPIYRVLQFLLGIFVFRERVVSHAAEAAVLVSFYGIAIVLTACAVWAVGASRFLNRWHAACVLTSVTIGAAFLTVAPMAADALHRHATVAKWVPAFPSLALISLFGGAAFGALCVARPVRIVMTNTALAAVLAAVHVRLWVPAAAWPDLTVDDAQFAWKVPAVGSILLLASSVAAWARAEGRPRQGVRRAALGLGLVAGVIWVQPFALPRTLTMADVARIEAAKLSANGDVILQVALKRPLRRADPARAIVARLHGESSLVCLSRRPIPLLVTSAGWIVLSPDGQRVVVAELAPPLASLSGQSYSISAVGVRSRTKSTLMRVPKQGPEDERGLTTILGLERSWAVASWHDVRGGLLRGNPFRVELPYEDSHRRFWFCGSELAVYATWCGASREPQFKTSCLFTVDLRNGRTQRFVLPIAGNAALDSISPDGRELVVRAFSNVDGATQGYYWLNSSRNLHRLADPPVRPARPTFWPRFAVGPRIIWWKGRPQFAPTTLDEFGVFRVVDGYFLAVGRGGEFYPRPGGELWLLDESLRPARRIESGVIESQWMDDSIVFRGSFTTMLGAGSRWVRYWPATDRQEVILEKLAFEMP